MSLIGFPSLNAVCGGPPSNVWILFFKSIAKNYCFVLFWLYSTVPNISLPFPPLSSKHFTLAVAQDHSDLTVGHFSSSDGSSSSVTFCFLQPGKYVVESQEYAIECTCTKELLNEYLLPHFMHSVQADLWNCHTSSSRGMVRCFYTSTKMKCSAKDSVSWKCVSRWQAAAATSTTVWFVSIAKSV